MARRRPANKRQLDDLWFAEFRNQYVGLCGLCGNSGYVDTLDRVWSAAGVACGIRVPCLCPNGRAMKKAHATASMPAVGNTASRSEPTK